MHTNMVLNVMEDSEWIDYKYSNTFNAHHDSKLNLFYCIFYMAINITEI